MNHDDKRHKAHLRIQISEEENRDSTPRAANSRGSFNDDQSNIFRGRRMDEVDVYENPTELFQWINYANFQSAAARALEHPSEARTWLVSRTRGKKGEFLVKWRYLPLHLACMKSNPSEELIRALLQAHPTASRERDNDGNLPIHYLISEGCDRRVIIEMLLEVNPESIKKRDSNGRTLLDIVSEAYRMGKVKKDTMVNILAILRQWTIQEELTVHPPLENHFPTELREDPQHSSSKVTTFTFDNSKASTKRRHSRSKSVGRIRKESNNIHDTQQCHQSQFEAMDVEEKNFFGASQNVMEKKLARDTADGRLENVFTERDVLRKTVGKLKADNKNHEMVIATLNKQIEQVTLEFQKSKEKIKKKREKIDELQMQLQEQEKRFENHEKIFDDKEKKLEGKDKLLKELSDRVIKLVEENTKIREEMESGSIQSAKSRDSLHTENQELRQQVHSLRSKTDAVASVEEDNRNLRVKLFELEEKLEHQKVKQQQDLQKLQLEAKGTENQLHSRIRELEQDLMDQSDGDKGVGFHSSREYALIEKERNALQEMNASLQEHVGALKGKNRVLEDVAAERKGLQETIQNLEKDLNESRQKQHFCRQDLESLKSEAVINDSRLQTKVARLEKELLDLQTAHDLEASSIGSLENEKNIDEIRSLQDMNASLKEHICALMAKCSTLEKSLSDTREKNTKLNEDIRTTKSEYEESRASLERSLEDLQEKNSDLFEELHTANIKIADQERNVNALVEKSRSLEMKLSEERSKYSKLSEELRSVKRENADERARNADQERNVNTMIETSRMLETKLLEERSRNLKLAEDLRAAKCDTIEDRVESSDQERSFYSMMDDTNVRKNKLSEETHRYSKLVDKLEMVKQEALEERTHLEKELLSLKDENSALLSQLKVTDHGDLGERQKELQAEFKNLFSMVQGIAQSGTPAEGSIGTGSLKLENDALRREAQQMQSQVSEAKMEIQRLRAEINNIRINKDSSPGLRDLSIAYRPNSKSEDDDKSNDNDTKKLKMQLAELSDRAEIYKQQLLTLKENYDLLQNNNMNLREIIKKNNSTYTVKVESLTHELESLRQENESLQAEIHDLRSWNSKLRNGSSADFDYDEDFRNQIDELASRVNQVTGFLIALSLTLETSDQDANHVGRGGDTESYYPAMTKKESAREELREAVFQRRETLLASDDRDDIMQMASDIESEMRSSSIHTRQNFLSDQREELRSISTALKSFR